MTLGNLLLFVGFLITVGLTFMGGGGWLWLFPVGYSAVVFEEVLSS